MCVCVCVCVCVRVCVQTAHSGSVRQGRRGISFSAQLLRSHHAAALSLHPVLGLLDREFCTTCARKQPPYLQKRRRRMLHKRRRPRSHADTMQDTPGRCLDEIKKELAGAHLVRASTLSIWRAHRAPVLWGDLGSSLVGLGRSAHHQADAIEDARFHRHVERGDADHANCSATDEGVRGPQPRATRRLWTEGTRARRRMASGASSARAAWWRHAAVMGLRVLRAGGWMAPWRVMGSSGGWWRRPSFQPRADASSQAQAHRAPSWTLQRRAARLWFVHPEPQRW